ncbi:purine-nucleoside phosphorylase [Halothermothrix orenii]|uniref:Purine nucleoside phosphorylase n=1 Tax=Halothermothrix orenii (strain H 168 / OCM 544 / DSM 9562) TaxID=373903 RepID=B8CVY4_HALOH|nr:purine-nucleoside phosphorylase [Halothermothrix orenii]ACL69453.1 purine nucleoside phosphorylase I, inosine and guanosine-specific [Halothermothrix orenii H 168]
MLNKIKEASSFIEEKINIKPDLGLILGSGLGVLAEEIENPIVIPYKDIPNFPLSTVEGHAGQLVIGELEGNNVITMQGRFHHYEGYSLQELTMPVRVMGQLGVNKLIVTNAAGGINLNFRPGDLMLITDHINMMGDNPLIGKNFDEFGPRFPDMTYAYSKDLIEIAERVASSRGINVRKGVYVAVTGPSFETPAEIRFLRRIGADAVGMSTVPEVIVANHMGFDVLGISCISNMAAGVLPEPLSHDDVMEISSKVKPKFINLVRGILEEM